MMKNPMIIIILVGVVALGAGFFGGMKYQQGQIPAAGAARGTGQFRQRGGAGTGANANFQPVRGEILSVDSNSITVKMTDGSSKIVLLSASTMITQSSTVSAQVLQTGKQVMVIGTTNSDGSVTAQNVQLNPLNGQFRGGPGQPTGR